MLVKEGYTCLSFLEACGAALRACPIEAHGVLLYPLQLLMGNILLASLLTATPQPAPLAREPPLTVPPPLVSKPSSSPTGAKQWCHPSGEEATGSTASAEKPTCQKWKEGKTLMGLKETPWVTFHWDTDLVQAARWMYFEAHHPCLTRRDPTIFPVFFRR